MKRHLRLVSFNRELPKPLTRKEVKQAISERINELSLTYEDDPLMEDKTKERIARKVARALNKEKIKPLVGRYWTANDVMYWKL